MIGTVVVGAVLALVVAGIVMSIVRDKKSGKGTCGGDCSKCKGCH